MTPETRHHTATLALAVPFGHQRLMPKAKDAERICFIVVPGSKQFFQRAADLDGIRIDAWMRAILHAATIEVLDEHGHDTSDAPAVHIQRPPRLQPRFGFEDEEGDSS